MRGRTPQDAAGRRPGSLESTTGNSQSSRSAWWTTVPKVGGLLAAYRVLDAVPTDLVGGPLLIALLAALTMTLGNLAAFGQDSPRRLLGWSSVSQAGNLFMAVAVAGRTDLALPSPALYLAAYAVTNIGAFAVTADGGFGRLVVVAAVTTVVSLFYYLRWLGPALSRSGDGQAGPRRRNRSR